jgi:putative transposase
MPDHGEFATTYSRSYDKAMSEYRRNLVPGGIYLFTLVTHCRLNLFADAVARQILGTTMRRCFRRYPVKVVAFVLLPDHLHAIWTLPPGDSNYSLRWGWIKREFTRGWLASGGADPLVSEASAKERRRGIWQRRFWEHTLTDERDVEAHVDYIHFNPVKHGLVQSPRDWPWSSFHRYVRAGQYAADWAGDSSQRPHQIADVD